METIMTALFGGATGIIGTVIGKAAGYFEKKQEMEILKENNKHELSLQEMQISARAQELESEAVIAETKAFSEMRSASYDRDASYGKPYRWVITLLRLVRPILTIMLIILTAILFFNLSENGRDEIASQVIFLTGMSISWWFGDRYKGGGK